MDYEKKYKEALEKAQRFYNNSVAITNKGLEDIFPELAESEDERIRKSLIILLQHFCKGYRVPGLDFPVSYKDMLAWLEKQGEQKPIVIPKFRVGDIIRHKEQGFTCKITAVDTEYRVSDCCGTHLPFDMQDYYELVEQNPTWSEEDEKCIENAIMYCEWARDIAPNLHCYKTSEKSINWLKSLKERYTWKPSDLQLEALESATENCAYSEYQDRLRELIGQLKKLKG